MLWIAYASASVEDLITEPEERAIIKARSERAEQELRGVLEHRFHAEASMMSTIARALEARARILINELELLESL